MKKFIKNNKAMTIGIICCVIFVILVYMVKLTFFPNEAKAIYGDRLDGIKEVEITKNIQDKIVKGLEEKEEVKEAKTNIQGRILNVLITVEDEVELDAAKSLTTVILDNLKNKQKKYYDIQVFVSKKNDDTRFPIIGYKHQDKDEFSWSKDR